MKYPFEHQNDLKDCGVCCLKMLIRYYGGGVSNEYLRQLTNTTKEGVSAYDLIDGAIKVGFDSYGVRGNVLNLEDRHVPCIAHVVIKNSYQHFIVIYKIDKKKNMLTIADPNDNRIKKMSILDFNKISSNNFILLYPCKKIMLVDNNTALKEFLFKTISLFTPDIVNIIFLSFIVTVAQVFLSFEFKLFFNNVIQYNIISNLYVLTLIFILVILLKNFSNYYRNRLVNSINHKLDKSLFSHVYNHILSLPYLYYKNRTTGEIVARLNDLIDVRDVLNKFIVTITIDLFMFITCLLLLFFLNSQLTFIILFIIFLQFIILLAFNKPLEERVNKTKHYGSKLNSYLVETIGGIETIKFQNIVPYIYGKFNLNYSLFNNSSSKHNVLYVVFDLLKNLVSNLGYLSLLVVGSYLLVLGDLDIPSLITFITLSEYIFSPVESVMELILSIKNAKVAFNRIKELYEIQEEKKDDSSLKYQNVIGNIKTDKLVYSYNNRDLFLKNINLDIDCNDKVLIYGKSGSGKSTLAKIIAGALVIPNKYVYFNNIDINKYSVSSLRKDICYVSSKETLFIDTVYDNIVLDKEISQDDFYSNAKLCMVDEFIEEKSLAYNTLIEEGGFNFSGGEKQRLILARALLKNSNIYILDEALNQVDVERERKILKNIFDKYPNKTFIYISHRFHNKDLFNKKYRIEDGISFDETV